MRNAWPSMVPFLHPPTYIPTKRVQKMMTSTLPGNWQTQLQGNYALYDVPKQGQDGPAGQGMQFQCQQGQEETKIKCHEG